jgi:hypothetical protein
MTEKATDARPNVRGVPDGNGSVSASGPISREPVFKFRQVKLALFNSVKTAEKLGLRQSCEAQIAPATWVQNCLDLAKSLISERL